MKDSDTIITNERLKRKHCIRCGGFIFLDRDIYGTYENCANCGYIHEVEPVRKPISNLLFKEPNYGDS